MNFDFLAEFNSEAYEIALQIEDEVTISPASIKTYATTFLECIVDSMILKSGNRYNVSPYDILIQGHCIICVRKNNSQYHNLCNSCNNKIEHVEDVINLKNNFTDKFNKKHIVDLGYPSLMQMHW